MTKLTLKAFSESWNLKYLWTIFFCHKTVVAYIQKSQITSKSITINNAKKPSFHNSQK